MASRNKKGLPGSTPEVSLTEHTPGSAAPAPPEHITPLFTAHSIPGSPWNSSYFPSRARLRQPAEQTRPAPHPRAPGAPSPPGAWGRGCARQTLQPLALSQSLPGKQRQPPPALSWRAANLPVSHTAACRDFRLNPRRFQHGSSYSPPLQGPRGKAFSCGRSPGGQRGPEPCPG